MSTTSTPLYVGGRNGHHGYVVITFDDSSHHLGTLEMQPTCPHRTTGELNPVVGDDSALTALNYHNFTITLQLKTAMHIYTSIQLISHISITYYDDE